MPEPHVVAAGSLLEFALQSLPSYGVGRVRSLFMYPFSFDEFLEAIGEQLLLGQAKCRVQHPLPDLFHQKLLDYLKTFMLTGGMPEAVASYVKTRQMLDVQRMLDDLFISLRADFTKYKIPYHLPV
ncbi:MAG: hypothetical protein IPL27_14645 [Lewinellaceae bacterium]|nr:hypothetical protein [Lewinellaceae bacterium]